MKFLKLVKNKFKMPVVPMPEQDVTILAMMCRYCNAAVKKHGFIDGCYAYYVPDEESDVDVAKKIFEKNGIYMSVHFSHILSSFGQKVLRINYDFVRNKGDIRREIKRIEEKSNSWFQTTTRQEKEKLNNVIMELKQKQK